MADTESLDRAYLTIDDFLNSKHCSSDAVNHNRTLEDIQLHFNKPGFDLAVIITDQSLIPTIADFQCFFQSTYALTTHVIYLPDVSRMKFCIRDLKLHEILYAIIVNVDSKVEDDYDVYVLNNIIEYQSRMHFEEAIDYIKKDLDNYMTQVKEVLTKQVRNTHPNNGPMIGYHEPDKTTRYLLCLLFDNRMLKKEELLILSDFVQSRKDAIAYAGDKPINYGINDRPIPSFRQDKLKYYIYEFNGNKTDVEQHLRNEECKSNGIVTSSNRMAEVNLNQLDTGMHQGQPRFDPNSFIAQTNNNFVKTQPPIYNQFMRPPISPVSSQQYSAPTNPRMVIGQQIGRPSQAMSSQHNVHVQPLMNIVLPDPVEYNAVPQYPANSVESNPQIALITPQPHISQLFPTNKITPQQTAPPIHTNTNVSQSQTDINNWPHQGITIQSNLTTNPSQSQTTNKSTQQRPVNKCIPQSSENSIASQHPINLITGQSQLPIVDGQPSICKINPQPQTNTVSSQSWIDKISIQCKGNAVIPQSQNNANIHNPQVVIVAPQPPAFISTHQSPTTKGTPQVSANNSAPQSPISKNASQPPSNKNTPPLPVTVPTPESLPNESIIVSQPAEKVISPHSPDKALPRVPFKREVYLSLKNMINRSRGLESSIQKETVTREPLDNLSVDNTNRIISDISSLRGIESQRNTQQQTHHEIISGSTTIQYNLSPISNDEQEVLDSQERKIEIDLTDDSNEVTTELSSPIAKRCKYSTQSQPISTPKVSAPSSTEFVERNPSAEATTCKISCKVFVNFLKFVLGLAPFSLPVDNVVMALLKKCLSDVERHIIYYNQRKVAVDLRVCRTGGCTDVIRIIEALTGETISPKHNVVDLNFMWTFFPRNINEDSITVMFYQLMKMLELSKLVDITNNILVTLLEKVQRLVNYNFQLSESDPSQSSIMNFFPSLFSEYFDLRTELHNLNMSLPPPEPLIVAFNPDLDKVTTENRIKFVVGPLIEFFIEKINAIHYQLDRQTMEVIYWSLRSLRFCLRKISVRILPERLKESTQFLVEENTVDRTLEILDEINYVLREVSLLNCILFTKKHYEFVNLILDFSVKIQKTITGASDSELELPDQEYIIHIDPALYLNEFATNIKTAVLPYHHDTEVDVLKRALKNRWVDCLHQVFKGIAPLPEGDRMNAEVEYLLPKVWGKRTYNDVVVEAANLSFCDWDRMLTNDFGKARHTYNDVRNNYLMWLSNNGLDHRKAMELMTANQKRLDAKVLLLSV